MAGYPHVDPVLWRPQSRLIANIASLRQLQLFNDRGGIAVDFDTMGSVAPDITITGSQSKTLSLWETRSASGFVTKPKFDASLVTIRFVTSGHIVYQRRSGSVVGTPTHATLVDFDDLREVRTSDAFASISATLTLDTLIGANRALTGSHARDMPPLASTAEVATPGIKALLCTLREVQRRVRDADHCGDLIFPLVQEILGYQLLSAWPRRVIGPSPGMRDVSTRNLQVALDYIEANLSSVLILADIAAAAGISVRSLQDKFRKEIGRTPVQFITDRRLAGAHQDLLCAQKNDVSVVEIARSWGFGHMGDFGQRYRRSYGRTPVQTRRGT